MNRPTFAILCLAVILAGCGKEDSPKPADTGSQVGEAAQKMGSAMLAGDVGQVGEAMKQMGGALAGSVQVEPVDFRTLKDLLPENLAGLKRVSSEGSRTKVMGIAASTAEAVYQDGKGGRMKVAITDAGTLTGLAAVAVAWINVEIDKEGDSGYERTTTIEGRKAYERYEKASKTGKLDVVAAGRFLVAAESTGLDMKAFRAAIAKIDLARLDALKARGAPAPVAGK
ncbi:MAG: hypothetical protein IPJ28_03045 [Betaproteobacteria bacterium]|nr:hypothetical protein [Betaproteobacteria bacterium]